MVRIPDGNNHKGLYFGKYCITQEQWENFIGTNSSLIQLSKKHPVDRVYYSECQEFVDKLNALPKVVESGIQFHIPTDSEWIYACRAGSHGKYGLLEGGNEGALDEMGWYEDNSYNDKYSRCITSPVGQKKPNAWGLYDMHGNVWEWTNLGSKKIFTLRGGDALSSHTNCVCGKCTPSGVNKLLIFLHLDWLLDFIIEGFYKGEVHYSRIHYLNRYFGFRLAASKVIQKNHEK